MRRAYTSMPAHEVPRRSDAEIYGQLALELPFAVEPSQRAAWEFQIRHLRSLARELPNAYFFLEFLIPRMGRRADLIVINEGLIFVVEYKLGATGFDRSALNQTYGYGLDLKNFHESSHDLPIIPIAIATAAASLGRKPLIWDADGLAQPLGLAPDELAPAVNHYSRYWGGGHRIDAELWQAGRYRPTPTIIEAAQALYRGHAVDEISRSEAGAENLTKTADYVFGTIENAKANRLKSICFITGVPGSGKTLAGLNLATARQRAHSDEHAVFLSGNGPLVAVLREALAMDAVARARERGERVSKTTEVRNTSAFVQNIHHFRDEALATDYPPVERVAIFDEAQRAWDAAQTSKFMLQKRGQHGFTMSEPAFLLSAMDRHPDWCTIVCLVGGGQEINTGEAGIDEWLRALTEGFRHWDVHLSDKLNVHGDVQAKLTQTHRLHLATSIRSFRAERLSDFVGEIVDGSATVAHELFSALRSFPICVTRDLDAARAWLRQRRRGSERAGILASSNALRLKPHGIFIKIGIEPEKWFLSPSDDVRSSDALEDAASEFEVQGLELDWTCVCWDANFVRSDGAWDARQFKGTAWQRVSDARRRKYIANAYRVLLTRARQGMIIFVPPGDHVDPTRPPALYDGVFEYLRECGVPALN